MGHAHDPGSTKKASHDEGLTNTSSTDGGSTKSSPDADPLRGVPLRAILGPTATGKSALALAVAERAGAEIVSLDSMQVYRGMDIGTAKPVASERARVRHHMIDLVEPDERYDVQRFLRDLAPVLDDLRARGKPAIFAGGTGFYLKVLIEGLFEGPEVDPVLRERLMQRARNEGNAVLHAELAAVDALSAARIHANDIKRVVRGLEVWLQTGRALSAWQTQWGSTLSGNTPAGSPAKVRPERRLVGLALDSSELDRRILERARTMLARGWPEEAARIRAHPGFGPTAVQALGYASALSVHDGLATPEAAAAAIALETRQFARRQRTWWRKFADIAWFPAPPLPGSWAPPPPGSWAPPPPGSWAPPAPSSGTSSASASEPVEPALVEAALRALDLGEAR